jgi:hypothetical protein
MNQCLHRLAAAFAFVAMTCSLAYAQGGQTTAPLSGTVVDAQGAPIPGAAVVVKNEATGNSFQSVTNAQGSFTVPALQPGTYMVTVSLTGFKQAVFKGNNLRAATPLELKVTLEVGGMEETITVEGGTPLVQTTSAALSNTIEVNQITSVPVGSRNALDFLTLQPGVLTPGGNRDSIISGLDQSAINITVDGMSVQDNYLKTTDGYFARLSPRLDMVEEVTLTTAAANADNSAMGGAQITFTTRRGQNKFQGSVYEYFQRDYLNANSWFNNRDLPPDPVTGKAPQAKLKSDQFGFRLGGPILIPGLFDGRNRAHFFINYEESRSPADVTRQRIILSPQAQAGVYRYGSQSIDVLDLAARNGQLASTDPTVVKLLSDIRSAAAQGGIADLADLNTQRLTYQSKFSNVTKYPTVRLDFQLSQKHLLTMSGTLNKLLSDPDTLNGRDPIFPGFPVGGVQDSKRFIGNATLRSTINQNLVNELRVFGASGGATLFSTEINKDMWSGSVANQNGFQLNLNGACCATTTAGTGNQANNINNASSGPGLSSREASTKAFFDHLTWIKGAHIVLVRDGLHAGGPVAAELHYRADDQLRRDARRSRERAVHRRQLPRRLRGAVAGGARSLRDADRARAGDHRQRPLESGDGRVQLPRPVQGPGPDARVRLLHPRHVARQAEPHAQLRPALRAAAPDLPAEQQLRDGDRPGLLGRLRRGQPLQAGRDGRAHHLHSVQAGRGREQDRLEQLRAQRGRRLDADDRERLPALAAEHSPRSGRASRWPTRRNGMSDFTDTYGANPASCSTRTATRTSATSAACRCSSATSRGSVRRPSPRRARRRT